MVTCERCGKTFEKETQLRGHKMRCKDLAPIPPQAQPNVEQKVEEPKKYRTDKYLELPPPVIDWLKINFGNWLNYFEVGRTEWKKDFGGYALYVKVPEEYSTEWKRETRERYDNVKRRPATDEKGNPLRYEFVTPDIRYVSLQLELPRVLNMLERIKKHIIDNAHGRGIRLPMIGEEVQNTKTLEDYKKSLYK